jgi:hypothetical protein
VGCPPWPRCLVQTGSAHRVGHRLDRFQTTFHAKSCALKHGPRVPPCFKTANQVRPWPRQATSWFGTRVSVGRTNYLLKTLQFKRICPTQACTKPRSGSSARTARPQTCVPSVVRSAAQRGLCTSHGPLSPRAAPRSSVDAQWTTWCIALWPPGRWSDQLQLLPAAAPAPDSAPTARGWRY